MFDIKPGEDGTFDIAQLAQRVKLSNSSAVMELVRSGGLFAKAIFDGDLAKELTDASSEGVSYSDVKNVWTHEGLGEVASTVSLFCTRCGCECFDAHICERCLDSIRSQNDSNSQETDEGLPAAENDSTRVLHSTAGVGRAGCGKTYEPAQVEPQANVKQVSDANEVVVPELAISGDINGEESSSNGVNTSIVVETNYLGDEIAENMHDAHTLHHPNISDGEVIEGKSNEAFTLAESQVYASNERKVRLCPQR